MKNRKKTYSSTLLDFIDRGYKMKIDKKKIVWIVIFSIMFVVSVLAIIFADAIFGVETEEGVAVTMFTKWQSNIPSVFLKKLVGYIPLLIKAIQFLTIEIPEIMSLIND